MYICGVNKKQTLTVVSTKEFVANENKYFDMAINEDIFVKRDNMTFIVSRVNDRKQKIRLKPDDYLRRAITIDELRIMVKDDIHQIYSAGK